jgi:protein-tyrosine-phosphatase
MAEALARKYGSDVLTASSAGLWPAVQSHAVTRSVLREINVDLGQHSPRALSALDLSQYDLIVNISGEPLPVAPGLEVETWNVEDPYGRSEDEFRRARGEIEMKVMNLILRIRTGKIRGRGNGRPALTPGR